MADYCPVASGLLAHPPEPQPKAELMQAIPAITPPPSPAQRALTLRNPKGEFLHWGCLKPLDSQAPFQNWFFARERDVYAIGAAASMDIRVREPVMRLHQCSLVWNGTDDRNAILIIDYSSSPHPDGLCTGTFVNRKRLEDGVPVVLRHGDETLYSYNALAAAGCHIDIGSTAGLPLQVNTGVWENSNSSDCHGSFPSILQLCSYKIILDSHNHQFRSASQQKWLPITGIPYLAGASITDGGSWHIKCGNEDARTALPDTEHVSRAAEMTVYDVTGNKVLFGDLIKEHKTIVVFIRHFFCGICQAYVSQLASIRSEALKEADVDLIVIGCGEYQPIKNYAETTGFTGPIYANPSRDLFRHFNLVENLARTPSDQPKKSYLAGHSTLGNAIDSIWKGPMKHPQLIGKQGNIFQLGGDFIFGPGNTCSFASRMKHTEDHVEVEALLAEVGITLPT
ncbi:hypothetical protein NM688_g1460 [Phlebia brevispora]|uniref:Uncharacterized protein n=1 Tax=Phlebia brevispora TaxID=194682 RepID=A0ACC1TB96_9APHY|nr:hypothetical protein NM688_g1460 [Phlebia brevispora]